MNKKSRVSVVIPFYNCPYVDQALDSVLAQSYTDIEIIVVDDGSTIHVEKLAPYMGSILYIRKENGGTASALNQGIKAATGGFFAWLSADDVFHPDKIGRQLEMLQSSGLSFNHTAYYCINERGERLSEAVNIPFVNRKQLLETMMNGCTVNGSSVLMDMDIFRKLGLFNEAYLYTHDYELWLRLLPYYELSFIETPLLNYRVHEAMGSVVHSEPQRREIKRLQAKYRMQILRLLRKEDSK
ncbi:glycosyltransferase family 2 protein [Paenibacillus sp. GCM10012306]|uniref:glycosyltransferase family 2 protein n=1 Tax=Paenibacillus sp. GCM10012306 TaxID=3317342 RepID=UPI003610126C